MEVARASAHLEREGHDAACSRADRWNATPLHRGVEDDARVGAAFVPLEELHDRVAADLLLAVADDAQVHRQLALRREQHRTLQQRPELSLVVGHAARVEPLVADGRLERLAVPELERRRRLYVEVAVDEDRACVTVAGRRRDLADDERLRVSLLELGLAAGSAHEVAHPLPRFPHVRLVQRVRTDARNAQELGELVKPRLVHERGVYAGWCYATSRRICASASARSFFSV